MDEHKWSKTIWTTVAVVVMIVAYLALVGF
jgi:hypothetical protein